MPSDIQLYEARRNEAWQKLFEILNHGYSHADHIEIEEAKHEFAKRYMYLGQMGWPQFFQKEIKECPLCEGGLYYVMTWEGRFLHFTCKECNAHIKLDILKGLNQSFDRIYEVVREA
jgi:hypothetical protein